MNPALPGFLGCHGLLFALHKVACWHVHFWLCNRSAFCSKGCAGNMQQIGVELSPVLVALQSQVMSPCVHLSTSQGCSALGQEPWPPWPADRYAASGCKALPASPSGVCLPTHVWTLVRGESGLGVLGVQCQSPFLCSLLRT